MQRQHGSVQTTSPEPWLSPGSGHRAATSASSPAELVELLSKWLSIKRREKKPNVRYRQCFQPGRIPRGFHGARPRWRSPSAGSFAGGAAAAAGGTGFLAYTGLTGK